jgi:hypothetical protein
MSNTRRNLGNTGRQKTSVMVNQELWKKWILFVVNRRGSARKLSQELEGAMKEYMKNHQKDN